jgi:dTDP-4-dehydrorhamnose reductase
MKIAVTGATGQLGSELCRQFGARAVGLSRPQFDVTDFAGAAEQLRAIRPHAVINCAAYTQVDRAEQEPEACLLANAQAVENLARVCESLDCVLVQISTDYVFGAEGVRGTPHRETDPPRPQGVYARSKLAGEEAAQTWPKHFAVRTCGLYAAPEGPPRRGRNFVETMLSLGAEGRTLRVVNDQFCTPTFVPDLAEAVGFLLTTGAYGMYHVTNAGATSWFDFARAVFQRAGLRPELHPITSAEYGAAAPRPAYSVLDISKYESLGGPRMPTWEEALTRYFELRAALGVVDRTS